MAIPLPAPAVTRAAGAEAYRRLVLSRSRRTCRWNLCGPWRLARSRIRRQSTSGSRRPRPLVVMPLLSWAQRRTGRRPPVPDHRRAEPPWGAPGGSNSNGPGSTCRAVQLSRWAASWGLPIRIRLSRRGLASVVRRWCRVPGPPTTWCPTGSRDWTTGWTTLATIVASWTVSAGALLIARPPAMLARKVERG